MIIDTTTGHPEEVESMAARFSENGIRYRDATLGGSSVQIAGGEAIVLCGAEDRAFTEAEWLLHHFGTPLFHRAPPGSGTRMKLVLNMALGLERAVLAEALEFTRHTGIQPERALVSEGSSLIAYSVTHA